MIDLFKAKFLGAWKEFATDPSASYKGFDQYYLETILRDAAGVAGLELCRRTLGLAHVKDMTSIADANARARAEKMCIVMGKRFIMERRLMKNGTDFMKVIAAAGEAYSR